MLHCKLFSRIFLFIFALHLNLIICQNITITSANYPNPYTGILKRHRVELDVPQGYGVAVLFYQFLAGFSDCVIACETETEDCSNACGDVMDHPKLPKLLLTNSSAQITMQSIDTAATNMSYSGIQAVIIPYNKVLRTFHDCGSTITVSDGNPFYFISQNYPETLFFYAPCMMTFESKDNIRLALYDLSNNANEEYFIISGQKLYDTAISNTSYSGRHITDDEPFGVYYKSPVIVYYRYTPTTTFYTRRFYILVDSFKDESLSSSNCLNPGTYQVTPTGITFGSKGFPTKAYANNMQCSYSFTIPSNNNSLLAIALSYESEKCCDTMTVDGISPWPFNIEVYQGFMGSYLTFAANTTVTLDFLSDGVTGALGFYGQAYLVSCVCSQSTYNLKSTDDIAAIASPGFLEGAPTYCPNLSCEWTVSFPEGFIAVVNIDYMGLRQSPGGDEIMIRDAFGQPFVDSNTSWFGPTSVHAITSPITLSFTSTNPTKFDLNSLGRGFSMEIGLQKKLFVSQTIQLSDSSFFADLSLNQFKEGLEKTYEFIISARVNRKVTIYFFSTLRTTVFLEIFDGRNAKAQVIDTTPIFNSVVIDGRPVSFTSSGTYLTVRITANTDYALGGLDFQAMVSDLENSGVSCNCDYLVDSLTKLKISRSISFTTNCTVSCYKVLHVTDPTYNPMLGISLIVKPTDTLEVFKGLNIDPSYALTGLPDTPLPSFIPGSYLVIRTDTIAKLQYTWRIASYTTSFLIEDDTTATFMSSDYLPQMNNTAEQQFSIQLLGSSIRQTGIRLEFVKSVNSGHGAVLVQQDQKVIGNHQYSRNSSLIMEYCGNEFLISYAGPGGFDNGLYARFKRADLVCSSRTVNLTSFLVFLVLSYFS